MPLPRSRAGGQVQREHLPRDPEPGALELESKAAEVGTARRRVAVSGQGLAFAASVRYWQDALGKPKNGASFAIAFDERMVKADGGSLRRSACPPSSPSGTPARSSCRCISPGSGAGAGCVDRPGPDSLLTSAALACILTSR